MIVIDETIRGIWFAPVSDTSDYMAALRTADGDHILTYRFRYSHSPDPWDDKDEKHWYELKITDHSEREIIDKVRKSIVSMVALSMTFHRLKEQPVIHELLRGSLSVQEFADQFKDLPFVHTKHEHLH